MVRLCVDAGVTGDRQTALQCLLLDPVITDLDVGSRFWMIIWELPGVSAAVLAVRGTYNIPRAYFLKIPYSGYNGNTHCDDAVVGNDLTRPGLDGSF